MGRGVQCLLLLSVYTAVRDMFIQFRSDVSTSLTVSGQGRGERGRGNGEGREKLLLKQKMRVLPLQKKRNSANL